VSSKTYWIRIVGTNTDEYIEANEIAEIDGRVKFLGHVDGYDDLGGRTVIASYLSSQVLSYGLVPLRQQAKEGNFTFRVFFADRTTQDVRADQLRYVRDNEGSGGLFNLVTELGYSEHRTEFSVMKDKVSYIKRVEEDGDAVKGAVEGTDVPVQSANENITSK
jgi:hypothetical protein